MKKKLFAGVTIMTLALGTGAVVFATATPQEAPQYQNEISMGGDSSLSFDKIDNENLPDGVFFQDEIYLWKK